MAFHIERHLEELSQQLRDPEYLLGNELSVVLLDNISLSLAKCIISQLLSLSSVSTTLERTSTVLRTSRSSECDYGVELVRNGN